MNPLLKFFAMLPNVHTLHGRITAVYEFWLSLYTMLTKLVPAAPVHFETAADRPQQYSAPVQPPADAELPPDHSADKSGALGESAKAQSPSSVAL